MTSLIEAAVFGLEWSAKETEDMEIDSLVFYLEMAIRRKSRLKEY
ncbi:MAG: hypothetical protein P4L98_05670 [Ancalomicrobiaceae bacterium]|nr:hypothetical protein [Ancalomicrobiaceae bacterium]